ARRYRTGTKETLERSSFVPVVVLRALRVKRRCSCREPSAERRERPLRTAQRARRCGGGGGRAASGLCGVAGAAQVGGGAGAGEFRAALHDDAARGRRRP